MSTKKALSWVALWIGLALCFNAGIYIIMGQEKALEFLSGYLIEQSLSMDNLFLFVIIFTHFGLKQEYQRRVLNYGIAGAAVLRLIFILLGVTVINMFHSILYLFGAVLIFSGIKMAIKQEKSVNLQDNRIIKLIRKFIPLTDTIENERFFIKKGKVLYATPLFAIIVLIEFTDILFAIDSIPAIFSITTDALIVYTSNIFAILGLRSLYFVLGTLQERFRYVKYGISFILVFTGVKLLMLVFGVSISHVISLGVILFILAGSIILSLALSRKELSKSPFAVKVK